MSLSNFFYRNSRLTLLAICLILVGGLSSLVILPRMEDPQMLERAAFIHTVFPGADPARVESLVSEKIEDALSEIKEIKEIRSISRESISSIAIELRDDVVDADRAWSKIRDRLSDIQKELPSTSSKPRFEELNFKAFAMLVGLYWDRSSPLSDAVLYRWAKQLEDCLNGVSGTEKTELFGHPSEEILVTADSDQLTALRLTIADISRQIVASDSKVSAGQLRSETNDVLIEVAGELHSIQRIENIPIRYEKESGFVRLSSIASVVKTTAQPPDHLAIIDGQRGIVVGAFVRPDQRIDVWSHSTADALKKFESELPVGLALDRLFDQNDYVARRLSTLTSNLLLGGAAVFMVIFFLMGWRSALVVSIALPLASLMVLFGMRMMSIPIHQMSVTGIIIALGLLIDNAIVIVEEMSQKMRAGVSPGSAVSQSVRHLALPLFGSTVTTALAFAPIALMPGPTGEFVSSIAINVIVAIFCSLFLAMTIIPAIAARINAIKPLFSTGNGTSTGTKAHWWRYGFYNVHLAWVYRHSLDFVFRRPFLGILLGIALPILGFTQAANLQEQFFPPADRDQLNIELELSPVSSMAKTLETTRQIRELLLKEPSVKRVDWFVGESGPAFYYNLIPRRSAVSQYAQAMVQLTTAENQPETIHHLQDLLDEHFAHARVLVRQLEQGPPFDAPVEVRLYGPDLEQLRTLGSKVRTILANTPGVIHTRADMSEMLPKISLNIKEERARAAGLSLTDIAAQLNAATEGMTGGSIVEATEELPIRVRLDDASRGDLAHLSSIDIISPNGDRSDDDGYQGVPLSAIAEFELQPEFGAINHLQGRRVNEIQAFIPAGVLPSTVLSSFKQRLAQSDLIIPTGYSLSYGGESAKREEAIQSLMASMGILVVLMIATLVLSFGSFRIVAIIGVVGVLSIGLGMGSLVLFGYPFGFTAIVGIMGLMGVAINDTIVVLAAIRGDEYATAGDRVAMRNVVTQSTRHIVSTSLTTIAGFMPLIIAGGGFWPPLAVGIAGGVGGATLLALYLVPSAYLILMCPKPRIR